jgi:hypothetical protein
MSIPVATRLLSTLTVFVMTLGLAVSAAAASEPVVIESSAWTTLGTMKARVNGLKQELAVVVTLEFGPGVDLLAGQFRLTVDDGVEPFSIVGPYQEEKPGKPSFGALSDQIAAALGVAPELEGLDIKARVRARPKLRDGVETMRVSFKFKLKLSLDGESMSIAVGYKGEGVRAE